MTVKVSRRTVLAGAAGLAAKGLAHADWEPANGGDIIVPAAPGGTTDVMGRLLGQHLQAAWGQSTIVENKSAAGGTIADDRIPARQKPTATPS